MSGDTVPARPDPLETATAAAGRSSPARARAVLDAHWRPGGYTVPNATVYPHQWLWDSCFHAIAWAHLGVAERATRELTNVFARQDDDGFVPHMTYWRSPSCTPRSGGDGRERHHPAADVRPRRGRAGPPRDPGRRRAGGARRGRPRVPARADGGATGRSCRSCTRGSRGATTAPAGIAGPGRTARPSRGVPARASWSRRSSRRPDGSAVAQPLVRGRVGGVQRAGRVQRTRAARRRLRRGARRSGADAGRRARRPAGTRRVRTWADAPLGSTTPPVRTLEALLGVLVTSDRDRAAAVLRPGPRRRCLRRRVRPGAGAPRRAGVRPLVLLAGSGLAAAHLPVLGRGDAPRVHGRGGCARDADGGGRRPVRLRGVLAPRHRSRAWVPSRSRGRRWSWSMSPAAPTLS